MEASFYGHAAVVDRLIEARAKVYLRNEDGMSALDWTKQLGREDMVGLLAGSGAK